MMRKKLGVLCLVYAGILLLWLFLSQEGSLLPPPSLVMVRLWELKKTLYHHLVFTAQTMLFALGGAVVLSLPLTWLVVNYRWMALVVQACLLSLQCLPMFALAPLMILWFGWTHTSVIVPTLLMMVFPLVINSSKGFLEVPASYIELFSLHGAGRKELFFQLKLPYALPFIFAGLRVAVSFSGVGAIAGEFAGAQRGLGVFLQECRRDLDIEGVLAGLLSLFFLTLSFYMVLSLLERVFCRDRAHV